MNIEQVQDGIDVVEAKLETGIRTINTLQQEADAKSTTPERLAQIKGEVDAINQRADDMQAGYLSLCQQREDLQRAAVERQVAGEILHDNAPGVPDLKQQLTMIETMMAASAKAENISDYMALKKQRKEFIAKHGNVNREVIVRTSESVSAKSDRDRSSQSTITANNPNADIGARMAAAADCGDLETYKRLRKERNSAA